MNRQNKHSSVNKEKLHGAALAKHIAVVAGIVIICILLAFGGLFGVLYSIGSAGMHGSTAKSGFALPEQYLDSFSKDYKKVTYNGVNYKYNSSVTAMLIIGVDRETLGMEGTTYGTAGQSDVLYLAAVNAKENSATLIAVNRDSITDFNVLYEDGTPAGVMNSQVCLSYAYGDGFNSSCTNTRDAVSGIFFNLPIETYFSMDCSALGAVVDALGSVTAEQFDYNGKSTGKTVKLTSSNIETYLRFRDTTQLDSGAKRIAKLTSFMKACIKSAGGQLLSHPSIIGELLDVVKQHCCTNLSAARMTYVAANLLPTLSDPDFETAEVPGSVTKGEGGYAEYIVDEQALLELMLQVFYIKK